MNEDRMNLESSPENGEYHYNSGFTYEVPSAPVEQKQEESRQEYQQEPVKKACPVKKGLKQRPVLTIVLCVILAILVGFGSGMLGVSLAADRIMAEISEDIESYISEAGATVLYRSVETTAGAAKPAMDEEAVAAACADSVVEIVIEKVTDYGWFGQGISEGAGSGVIISEDGYILTCSHVIDGAEAIHVALRNGDTYEATIIGQDKQTDIAIIKVDAEDLTPAVLGHSDDLAVGERVVAIGNPLGHLGGTVTSGIIGSAAREVTVEGYTNILLQTDAAINGGNSGGGLFNSKGELVGIVNARTSGAEGLNFAIPIDEVQDVVDDLMTYGYVSFRVVLGIQMVQIDDDRTAMSYRVDDLGVYILSVVENSNAEHAGLRSGDRLISIDGDKIDTAAQVQEIIGSHVVGDVIHVVVDRGGEEVELDVTLYGEVPEGTGGESATVRL